MAGLDYAPIDTCQMNIEGQDLVHDHGVETLNLEPTLYFVPWIIYNQVITKRKFCFNSFDLFKLIILLIKDVGLYQPVGKPDQSDSRRL